MKHRRKFVAGLLTLWFGVASAASFECSKATKKVEKIICSDPKLSKLDEELNLAYKNALLRTTNSSVVKKNQRSWLQVQWRECKECSTKDYEEVLAERISFLNDIAGSEESSSRWTGDFVRYWNGRKDDSARISILGLRGSRIYVAGEAFWYPPNGKDVGPNLGNVEGEASIKNGVAKFDFEGCKGEIRLMGRVIQVANEEGCGGWNVSFNGRYRRK